MHAGRRFATAAAPCRAALLALLCGLGASATFAADAPLLERDVLPVLTRHCLGCHGGLRKHGGLDLRTVPAMLAGGESGAAIVPGHGAKSALVDRILKDEMPEGNDREKLTAAEKQTIKAWIDAGLPTVSQQQRSVDPLLPAGTKHAPQEVAAAIDRHVETFLAAAKLKPVPRSDDAEFLRRAHLDLAGRVPTAEQAAAFLDDASPDKRAALIDTLLASPDFGKQFGRTWRDWVSPPELPSDDNGGGQPHTQADAFGKWIGERLTAGETWDRIVRDILTVEGEIKKSPHVIFYGLVGQGGKTTPEGTAQAVASLFLGVQLQCAQCHDDPYRDWSQKQHWELAAFFGGSQGDFNKIESGRGPNRKPGEIVVPGSAFRNAGTAVPAAFLGGSVLESPQQPDVRRPLADWLTAKENPFFARAFANRLWFHLFSRGLVNPIDDFRELNPPSHPGLLKLLENEFAASGFDVRHLVRCLCLSQAWQRTSRSRSPADERTREATIAAFGRMPMRVLTADRLLDSLMQTYGEEKEFDLRSVSKESTTGQAAPVAGPYLEFLRKFGTNEEDATDFTHGISQMLTLVNHPKLQGGSRSLAAWRKQNPQATPEQTVERLYLATLSRRPTPDELDEAVRHVARKPDPVKAYDGVLWMLVNRSEFLLVP